VDIDIREVCVCEKGDSPRRIAKWAACSRVARAFVRAAGTTGCHASLFVCCQWDLAIVEVGCVKT